MRVVRKPGNEVEAESRQTATGAAGQEMRSGTGGVGVLWAWEQAEAARAHRSVIAGESCVQELRYNLPECM